MPRRTDISSILEIPSPLCGRGWRASARRVRGRFKLALDDGANAVQVFKNIVVPETEDAKALTLKVGGSDRVSHKRMLTAVGFDDQSPIGTEKVDDVAIDFGLTAEFGTAKLSVSQVAPKLALGLCRVAAKQSRCAGLTMFPCQETPSPRRFRADPLPRRGEGICDCVNA